MSNEFTWPHKGTGSCACKAERAEDFGGAKIIEQCGYHARQSERIAELERRNAELEAAVDAVLQDALDCVEVHPCDCKDDTIRAKGLHGAMAQLYKIRHDNTSSATSAAK